VSTPIKFGKGPRMKLSVSEKKGFLQSGINLNVTNCDPREIIDIYLYSKGKEIGHSVVEADANGNISISLSWKVRSGEHKIVVRSKSNNDASEMNY
jgi:hypothetical protein